MRAASLIFLYICFLTIGRKSSFSHKGFGIDCDSKVLEYTRTLLIQSRFIQFVGANICHREHEAPSTVTFYWLIGSRKTFIFCYQHSVHCQTAIVSCIFLRLDPMWTRKGARHVRLRAVIACRGTFPQYSPAHVMWKRWHAVSSSGTSKSGVLLHFEFSYRCQPICD